MSPTSVLIKSTLVPALLVLPAVGLTQPTPFVCVDSGAEGTPTVEDRCQWAQNYRVQVPTGDDLVMHGSSYTTATWRRLADVPLGSVINGCNGAPGMDPNACSTAGEAPILVDQYKVTQDPYSREVPQCWPFPIGNGTQVYSRVDSAQGIGVWVYFCPQEDGSWQGYGGGGQLSNLWNYVSGLLGFTAEAAESTWESVPWRPFTDEERTLFTALADSVRPNPVSWVVASTIRSDRPVYSCDPGCLAERVRGGEVGRSGEPKVATCEGPLEPVWSSSGGRQWQFTTATNGERGVVLCEFP